MQTHHLKLYSKKAVGQLESEKKKISTTSAYHFMASLYSVLFKHYMEVWYILAQVLMLNIKNITSSGQ